MEVSKADMFTSWEIVSIWPYVVDIFKSVKRSLSQIIADY